MLLNSPGRFAEYLKSEKNQFRAYMENLTFSCPAQVIIFGAGHWGYEALKLLREKENCQIQAFVDNDEEKQGLVVENVKVYSLNQALCEFPKAIILIANETYYLEIKMQIEKERKGCAVLCPFE